MGQVPSTWQAQAHDARVRCQQSRVHGKVRWAARVRLDVHAPLLLAEPKSGQSAPLAEVLNLVDHLVATKWV